MSEGVRSIVIGLSGIYLIAAIAALLTWRRRGRLAGDDSALGQAARFAWVAIAIQAVHFSEELITGFRVSFPALLDLAPWSVAFFAAFNLAWLAIWSVATFVLPRRRRGMLFFLWFLAVASLVNLVAHPLMAVVSGGYFPGLITAPLIGVAGLFLARALSRLDVDS